METFETTLNGSDGPIDGVVEQISKEAYQFTSIDGALHLTITKNNDARWIRLAGSEPYLSGWVGELVERINAQPVVIAAKADKTVSAKAKPAAVKKPTPTGAKVESSAKAKPRIVKKAAPAKKASSTAQKESIKPAAKKITVKTDTSKKAKVSSGSIKTR